VDRPRRIYLGQGAGGNQRDAAQAQGGDPLERAAAGQAGRTVGGSEFEYNPCLIDRRGEFDDALYAFVPSAQWKSLEHHLHSGTVTARRDQLGDVPSASTLP